METERSGMGKRGRVRRSRTMAAFRSKRRSSTLLRRGWQAELLQEAEDRLDQVLVSGVAAGQGKLVPEHGELPSSRCSGRVVSVLDHKPVHEDKAHHTPGRQFLLLTLQLLGPKGAESSSLRC